MDPPEENQFPSFLGIQISNGDVIPIDIRYIGKGKIIFSLPGHNAKQTYLVSGNIGPDIDVVALKNLLNPYLIKFTEAEEIKLRMTNIYQSGAPSAYTGVNQLPMQGGIQDPTQQINQQQQVMYNIPEDQMLLNKNIDPNAILEDADQRIFELTKDIPPKAPRKYRKRNVETKSISSKKAKQDDLISNQDQNNYSPELSSETNMDYLNLQTQYEQRAPINQILNIEGLVPVFNPLGRKYDFTNEELTNTERAEARRLFAERLIKDGQRLYESQNSNRVLHEKALRMLRQGQIMLHDTFPKAFDKVVLPGISPEMIESVDPDAIMMSPKQFRRFMKRRLQIAVLQAQGKITERTSGILYPNRSQHAANRARDEFGIFKK